MKLNNTTARNATQNRHGFTLIELMVVIVIIGILMALILPALNGARIRARVTQVSTEISQLENGIAKFKSIYNLDPPSSLYVPPVGGSWNASDRSKIRSIWPQFDFDTNGGLGAGDFHLSGAECLVFFLGGVENATTTPPIVLGFSKNPRFPWSPAGTNREGPFYEFENRRFVDVDGDGLLEFVDPLPDQKTPYAYFSSQGRSYTSVNNVDPMKTLLKDQDDFDIHGGTANSLDLSGIYLKTVTPLIPQRADSFQIISAGIDGAYGVGGVYTDGSELVSARSAEADNITNFSGGLLVP
jgi:prepilin-type N-terminal cleavage/methylation domain-containing protein